MVKRCFPFSVPVLLMSILFLSVVQAQSRNLESYKQVYQREQGKIETTFTEKSQGLLTAYQKYLSSLLTRTRERGILDELIAVQAEWKRFEQEYTLSAEHVVQSPASLRSLQERSLEVREGLVLAKHEDVVDLKDMYVHHLGRLQAELTRQGKFDEAIQVRDEIERVEDSPEVTAAEWALMELKMANIERQQEVARQNPTVQEAGSERKTMEAWLGLRRDFLDKRAAYWGGGRGSETSREEFKTAKEKWEDVEFQAYQTLSVIRPEDPAAVKAIKADLKVARERLMEEMRIFAEKGGSKGKWGRKKEKKSVSKAKKEVDDILDRLEEALG